MTNKGRVLLLGAGGQLGAEWHRYLEQRGCDFRAFDSAGLNITDGAKLRPVFEQYRPELVLNCAAYTNVDKAEDEPDKARAVNTLASGRLARLCRESGAKLIHYSTDYIFPGYKEDRERLPDGYPEDHPAVPVNRYGLTKWEGEQAVRESGASHIIIRAAWLCGAYGGNFVKTMLRLAKERDEIRVVDDQYGSPTYTENLIQNTQTLVDNDFQGTIHVASSGLVSWHEFARAIFKISQIKTRLTAIPTSGYPTRAVRPFYSKLDISRLQKMPGSNIITWEDGLRQLLHQIGTMKAE